MTVGALVADGFLAEGVELGALTTYKLGGPARYYLEALTEKDLARAAAALVDEPMPVLVVGRGSNLVVADDGFAGLAIHLGAPFAEIRVAADGVTTAGGAASLPLLARTTVRRDRQGLEWCIGIPGSVGGAVRMNAGCHGSDTATCLVRARVFDLQTATGTWRTAADLELGYRTSNLTPDDVVVLAEFGTEPGSREAGEAKIRDITRWRREHQPGGTLNAGSVFKNPPGDAAGRIIDETGLKGFRVGGVSVSLRHANFFVAEEGASSQDLYDLVWAVRRRVGEATGIWLTPEIRFAGEFRPSTDEGAGP